MLLCRSLNHALNHIGIVLPFCLLSRSTYRRREHFWGRSSLFQCPLPLPTPAGLQDKDSLLELPWVENNRREGYLAIARVGATLCPLLGQACSMFKRRRDMKYKIYNVRTPLCHRRQAQDHCFRYRRVPAGSTRRSLVL